MLGSALTAVTVGAAVIFAGLPVRLKGSGVAKDTAEVVSPAQKLATALHSR